MGCYEPIQQIAAHQKHARLLAVLPCYVQRAPATLRQLRMSFKLCTCARVCTRLCEPLCVCACMVCACVRVSFCVCVLLCVRTCVLYMYREPRALGCSSDRQRRRQAQNAWAAGGAAAEGGVLVVAFSQACIADALRANTVAMARIMRPHCVTMLGFLVDMSNSCRVHVCVPFPGGLPAGGWSSSSRGCSCCVSDLHAQAARLPEC